MDAFIVVLKNVIIFVLLAVPGYLLAKTRKADASTGAALSKVLVSVGMPFLILGSVAKIQFSRHTIGILAASALIGIAYHYVLLWLSRYLAGKHRDAKSTGVTRFCMVFSNNGFLGLPLAMAIFGSDSLVVTSVIVVNILTNILMQTEGVSVIAGEKRKFSWGLLRNPLLISFAVGVVINLLGVFRSVPETVTYCTYLSGIVTPLSMLIIGIQLGGADLKKLFTTGRVYLASAVKLILVPAIIVVILLAAGRFVAVPKELVLGMFLAFAMPTAGLASAYASLHGAASTLAVYETIGSTVLSVATIPLLYLLLTCVI